MGIRGRKSQTKSPPILSHEFVIQNHADIVSCVAMVFVIGFFVSATQPYAHPFVTLQHNVTELHAPVVQYTSGIKDVCFIFFSTLIMIVLHAILQEYVLDKLNRKTHLSKSKHVKFNMSGQLVVFYTLCALWAANIMHNEGGILPISSLWAGYPGAPHDSFSFATKLFFICQIAYWLQSYTQLYFEKVKFEEYIPRIALASTYIGLFSLAYCLNLWKVGLVFTLIHYADQALLHGARLSHFYQHPASGTLFSVWNMIFLASRLLTTCLALLMFWFGLPSKMYTLRVTGISLIGATQFYMLFAFLSFHIGRIRQWRASTQKPSKKDLKKEKAAAKSKSSVDKSLPEADQVQPAAVEEKRKEEPVTPKADNSQVKKRLKARA